ncbi:TraR/DksA C4-type zinc finger protein [Rhodobacter sp. NTK016B]|uniref:TraR/DksA family transcriptional regulator n=1 Tax=Rhodobacter sp. NTK016B TaxID=2759676 RepID=UPI001A903D2D|nr:TraR/DksA C4-type zinc finger protein [Rhodobacter sp. NTK016B]MBN8291364.1 TraR/DksA C4-type zinc finger protein [Rhodobacter sp. NTK016B]
MPGTPERSVAERKTQLLARLRELDSRLHDIQDELLTHDSKDWEELATEREQDEMLTSMGEEGQQEIRAIRAAFKRMDEGEYGFCVTCGTEISAERLDVLPATPFCADCAP